jgi:hypothetical protein
MTFLCARALKNNWKLNKYHWKLNVILGMGAAMVSGGAAMILHLDGKIDSLSSDFVAQAEADRALAMANSQACINPFNALLRLHGIPPIPVPRTGGESRGVTGPVDGVL